ncbi:ASCH domain-containing protein [Tsukamurella sp. 8F]|uniref:ASCH domain-containing protein n=1 Tax=unclassified Tsukamurella TaxID=2633480 RepID=UPI0023B98787|nr:MULTISPECIES: ASCH domain-containing protein [unclassified Tsukamurella]MDF0529301.1 ASCH domain-containing protein [Tsukamurella sp. 8J]MDF0586862.1 ASCH domain-containing protein [Tsukamurella sp. 8F]
MLISKAVAEGIRDGRITAQFRRWDAPRVKVGGTQLTPAGLIRFTRVVRVADLEKVSDRAARAAGMKDAAALRRALAPRASGGERRPGDRRARGGDTVYRVTVEWAGVDPRIALRDSVPDDAELVDIASRLERLDRRDAGPWTRDILIWIRDNPRVVSKELAAERGVELLPMKADIRKLKALGLTISHDVGYEISRRGAAYLDWLGSARSDEASPTNR